MRDVIAENPQAKGIMMGQHGIINWADDDKECYELTLTLIEKAGRFIEERENQKPVFGGAQFEPLSEELRKEVLVDILPWLRGKVSQPKRLIATIQCDDRTSRSFSQNENKAAVCRLESERWRRGHRIPANSFGGWTRTVCQGLRRLL